MSEGEHRGAHDWLADLLGPPETICFLAQQGAEKYLKGYLVWRGVSFRKVHDMLEILNVCRSVEETFGQLEGDCQALNPYAVEVRYPGFATSYNDEDAHDALERAERIRRFVRDWTKKQRPLWGSNDNRD